MLGQKVPKVTAGSIFLGTFVATNALADPMTTTLFGIEYSEKPLLVKGFLNILLVPNFITQMVC